MQLSWWWLSSTGESLRTQQRNEVLQRQGWRAFTISSMSEWEKKRIRAWALDRGCQLQRRDWFRGDPRALVQKNLLSKEDAKRDFRDCCSTIWLSPTVSNEQFDAFMLSIPVRRHCIKLWHIDDKNILAEIMMLIREFVAHNHRVVIGYGVPLYLSLSDDTEAAMFRLILR